MRRERRYSLPRSVCRSTLLLRLMFSRCSGDRQLMSQQWPSDVLWMQRVEELVIWIRFARSELDNFNKKNEVRLILSEPLVRLPFVLELKLVVAVMQFSFVLLLVSRLLQA